VTRKDLEVYCQLKKHSASTLRIYESLRRKNKLLNVDKKKEQVIEKYQTLLAESYYFSYLEELKKIDEIEKFISTIEEPIDKNICRMYYIEGFSFTKIARMLYFSDESAVRRRLKNFFKKMQKEVR